MFRRKKKKTKINKQVIRQRRENRDIRHESSIRRFIREKKKEKTDASLRIKEKGEGRRKKGEELFRYFRFVPPLLLPYKSFFSPRLHHIRVTPRRMNIHFSFTAFSFVAV